MPRRYTLKIEVIKRYIYMAYEWDLMIHIRIMIRIRICVIDWLHNIIMHWCVMDNDRWKYVSFVWKLIKTEQILVPIRFIYIIITYSKAHERLLRLVDVHLKRVRVGIVRFTFIHSYRSMFLIYKNYVIKITSDILCLIFFFR